MPTNQAIMKLHWEEIFASLGDGLMILDTNRCLLAINPAGERLTGLSKKKVLTRHLGDLFAEKQDFLELIQPALEEPRMTTLREIRWHRRGEKKITVDLSVAPMLNEKGGLSGWILAFRDMTRVTRLQEEVRKSDRLAMLGTLAAGLAHEIKNPLGGIKGAAQLLAREKFSEESLECLGIIIKESDRVDHLVKELLNFTKPKSLNLQPINLNRLLNSILVLEKKILEERKIEVVREYDPSLPFVMGDLDELSKVFLNFIKNAIESIDEKAGKLWVRSKIETNYQVKGGGADKPARMVMAEVQDNGGGISSDNFEKIFTPFFTTKETGHGLGLPVAQRVIQEHGGRIRIRSKPGAGTTVQTYLRSVT